MGSLGAFAISSIHFQFSEGDQHHSNLLPLNESRFVLRGLRPSTKYSNFTLYATNELGTGNATSNVVVTSLKNGIRTCLKENVIAQKFF